MMRVFENRVTVKIFRPKMKIKQETGGKIHNEEISDSTR